MKIASINTEKLLKKESKIKDKKRAKKAAKILLKFNKTITKETVALQAHDERVDALSGNEAILRLLNAAVLIDPEDNLPREIYENYIELVKASSNELVKLNFLKLEEQYKAELEAKEKALVGDLDFNAKYKVSTQKGKNALIASVQDEAIALQEAKAEADKKRAQEALTDLMKTGSIDFIKMFRPYYFGRYKKFLLALWALVWNGEALTEAKLALVLAYLDEELDVLPCLCCVNAKWGKLHHVKPAKENKKEEAAPAEEKPAEEAPVEEAKAEEAPTEETKAEEVK